MMMKIEKNRIILMIHMILKSFLYKLPKQVIHRLHGANMRCLFCSSPTRRAMEVGYASTLSHADAKITGR